MRISDTPPPVVPPAPAFRRARSPEEAAKQFEEVLVKQFVRTMTDGLFESSLSGENGPSYVGAYGDMQKDALADELAQHLVKSGTLRISEMLLRQWKRSGQIPEDDPASDAPPHGKTLPGDPSLKES